MPNAQVIPGPQAQADGSVLNARGDNYGNTMVQQFNGKYAELWRRGQAWLYSTPAQAFLITNTTGNVPTLWNPAGSGKIGYVLQLSVAWLSGTNVAGSLLVAATSNTGSAIGTGAPIVTFTAASGVGNPSASANLKWAPSTCTFTAAPTVVANTGFNLAASQPTGILQQDFDGAIAIYPGQALSLVYSVTTSTALFYATALVAELPYFG